MTKSLLETLKFLKTLSLIPKTQAQLYNNLLIVEIPTIGMHFYALISWAFNIYGILRPSEA